MMLLVFPFMFAAPLCVGIKHLLKSTNGKQMEQPDCH